MAFDQLAQMENILPVPALLEELRFGLSSYWKVAAEILRESGIRLKAPIEEDFSFRKNFFSFLFLYSFYKAGIGRNRVNIHTTGISEIGECCLVSADIPDIAPGTIQVIIITAT